jgi:hypothetical protein
MESLPATRKVSRILSVSRRVRVSTPLQCGQWGRSKPLHMYDMIAVDITEVQLILRSREGDVDNGFDSVGWHEGAVGVDSASHSRARMPASAFSPNTSHTQLSKSKAYRYITLYKTLPSLRVPSENITTNSSFTALSNIICRFLIDIDMYSPYDHKYKQPSHC